MKNVLVIGGCGDMVTVTIKTFLQYDEDIHLTIFDFNQEQLQIKRQAYGDSSRTRFIQGNLFDKPTVVKLIAEADLVLNAAGPYYKTAIPIVRMCIEGKANLCDLNDEPDASMDVIKMSKQVQEAGIGVYIGLGASPGLTNIWAKELMEKLDVTENIDTAWCTGDEGNNIQDRGR